MGVEARGGKKGGVLTGSAERSLRSFEARVQRGGCHSGRWEPKPQNPKTLNLSGGLSLQSTVPGVQLFRIRVQLEW